MTRNRMAVVVSLFSVGIFLFGAVVHNYLNATNSFYIHETKVTLTSDAGGRARETVLPSVEFNGELMQVSIVYENTKAIPTTGWSLQLVQRGQTLPWGNCPALLPQLRLQPCCSIHLLLL